MKEGARFVANLRPFVFLPRLGASIAWIVAGKHEKPGAVLEHVFARVIPDHVIVIARDINDLRKKIEQRFKAVKSVQKRQGGVSVAGLPVEGVSEKNGSRGRFEGSSLSA